MEEVRVRLQFRPDMSTTSPELAKPTAARKLPEPELLQLVTCMVAFGVAGASWLFALPTVPCRAAGLRVRRSRLRRRVGSGRQPGRRCNAVKLWHQTGQPVTVLWPARARCPWQARSACVDRYGSGRFHGGTWWMFSRLRKTARPLAVSLCRCHGDAPVACDVVCPLIACGVGTGRGNADRESCPSCKYGVVRQIRTRVTKMAVAAVMRAG